MWSFSAIDAWLQALPDFWEQGLGPTTKFSSRSREGSEYDGIVAVKRHIQGGFGFSYLGCWVDISLGA